MNTFSKILILLIIISSMFYLPIAQLSVKDAEQDLKFEKALQNAKDSLQMVYQEELNRKIDSLKNIYEKKQDQFLKEFNQRKEVNYQYIQSLQDSLTRLRDKIQRYKNRNSVRDSLFEGKYYKYIDKLLEYKDKKRTNILGLKIGGREINEYKIAELKNYLNRFYPEGKSAYIRFYLTQVYNNQREYEKVEYSFLKFLYFYAHTPAYNELKHSLLKLILNNGYFDDRSSDIVKIMDGINQDADFQTRFYKFALLLQDYQNKEVQKYFASEVNNFLIMFENTPKGAQLLFNLYQYYFNDNKIQYAFLTLDKIFRVFPASPESDTALFKKAEIRAEHFQEYNQALSDYNRFIEENPNSVMAVKAHYQIATIFDNYLERYDMAFNKYQKIARDHPQSEFAEKALDQAATIAEEKLSDRQKAIQLYKELINKHPDSNLGEQTRLKLARLYYKEKQYQDAIDQYLFLYRQAPMEEKSIDYILRAADIYENKLEDIDMTIETLRYITENFPNTDEADEARKRINNLSQKR